MAAIDRQKAQRIIYLTAGFIKDELNFGEQQELIAWKNASIENSRFFNVLVDEDNRDAAVKKMQQFNTEGSLLDIKQKMAALKAKARQKVRAYGYAAAIILLWGLVFLFTQRQGKQPQQMTVNVPYGKVMKLTLPDSSRVWLNAGSVLQYPKQFAGTARHVKLKDGQAFFEVVHNKSKAFVVEANGANITVLGTSFEIKAFANENETKVTVSKGKVGVLPNGTKQNATMLVPDEQAIINKTSNQIIKHEIKTADIASWRENKLVFENENFQYVINALERKYNVRIDIEKKELLQQNITLKLDNQPLFNVLNVLSFSNNFTYKQTNEKLIVIR